MNASSKIIKRKTFTTYTAQINYSDSNDLLERNGQEQLTFPQSYEYNVTQGSENKRTVTIKEAAVM